jgi:hypothetical protein
MVHFSPPVAPKPGQPVVGDRLKIDPVEQLAERLAEVD